MAARQPVPIKTAPTTDPNEVALKLGEPYAGQAVTVRIDRIRRKHFRAIEGEEAKPNGGRQAMLLFDLIELVALRWSMRDEETGAPLPQPTDGGVDELTMGQMRAIFDAMQEHNAAATEPPKA